MKYLRKNTKQKRRLNKNKNATKKTHRRIKSVAYKKKQSKTQRRFRKKGGNLFPNPIYDKIVSIGYELESPFLIPLRDSDKNSKGEFFPHLYQIPPDKTNHHYDIYYEYTTPQRDETFKIITDNETTEFNVKIQNSPENIKINNLPVYVLDDHDEDLGGLGGLGHTEFLITFYKPTKHEQIIQTTLQKSIRYIHHYLQQLESLDVTVQIKGHATLPWKMFRDDHGNYYLPSFTNRPLSIMQSLDTMKHDMKFTIQMTFGSHFIDCIPIVQNLLANTNDTNLQEHAVFLNDIVTAVNENVPDRGVYTPLQMQYIKTYLILILYRYETFKKYEETRKSNPAALYKYECYFYIRHHFENLINLVQHQLGTESNAYRVIFQEYANIVENKPQYDSEYLDDFLMGKPDYLTSHQIDYFSTKFGVLPDDVVLIEFRGFQDELEQLITSYTPPSKHRQIQQDLEECSERIVGCYSLDTLNTFAAINFDTVDKAKKDKQRIMEAPRPSRTRKTPSRFDDA